MKYKNVSINAVIIFIAALGTGLLIHGAFNRPLPCLLKGMPWSEVYGSGINFMGFFQWLWIYFPLWLIGGYHVEMAYQNQSITLLKYRKRRYWYHYLYFECMILFMAYLAALLLLQKCCGSMTDFYPVFLIAAHALFMWFAALLIKELSGSGIIATTAILFLETAFYTSGESLHLRSVFVPSSWGMYVRSSLCEPETGFNPWLVITVQIIGCIIFYWLTQSGHMLKRRLKW